MKKFVSSLAIVAVAASLFASPALARPQYHAGLKKAYADNKALDEKKCGVCHGEEGKNKKVANDYGKALAEALGAKNVKEEDKIAAGIKAAGAKKEGDKTYDDIFKGGGLPKAAP